MAAPPSIRLHKAPSPYRDARSSPRIDVTDQLLASLVSSGLPLRVRDLSFGGCRLESAEPMPVGSLQQFRLETLDGAVSLIVTARVVHSRPHPAEPSVFVAGVRFIGPRTRDDVRQFDRLMDALTSSLSFGWAPFTGDVE